MRTGTRFALMLTLLSVAALIGPLASARYTGPSAMPTYKSVAGVLKNPVDDAHVTLQGHIIKQISKDKYLFSDGTAKITVEIDRKYFPATPVNAKTKIEIRGEVDKDVGRKPEIDVKSLTIVH